VTSTGYKLVQLANGAHSIHSLAYGETMHPAIGPEAEAEALYVKQLRLVERINEHAGEFVIWDVGLGAAANALAVLHAMRHLACAIRLVSFDHTLELLQFALNHAEALGYFGGYESQAQTLLEKHRVSFRDADHPVKWELQPGDFPTLLAASPSRPADESQRAAGLPVRVRTQTGILPAEEPENSSADGTSAAPWRRCLTGSRFMVPIHVIKVANAAHESQGAAGILPAEEPEFLPAPHAILFDPFSPAKNPAMWTLPLFTNLFRLLDPARPCALATYSRSTMTRAALLLAGFYVGAGHATGEKEQTTIAANTVELIDEPLDRRWLERARRSHSAEPLCEPVYRQAWLAPATWEGLQRHPQFR
jgi:tRNA U34 5-methylaminomethyl-2-thiouridine-forming methyltransferase MnmC